MDTLEQLMTQAPAWIAAITGVIAACTFVTALTPTKSDDRFMAMLLKILNILAGNVGRNRNADDV